MTFREWKSKKLDDVDRLKKDAEISFWMLEAESLFAALGEVEHDLKRVEDGYTKLTKEVEDLNTIVYNKEIIINEKEALIKQLIAFNGETQK